MGRPKGSRNRTTLEHERQSLEKQKAEKADLKKAEKEWNKATTAINDLIHRASQKGALVSDTGPIPFPDKQKTK